MGTVDSYGQALRTRQSGTNQINPVFFIIARKDTNIDFYNLFFLIYINRYPVKKID